MRVHVNCLGVHLNTTELEQNLQEPQLYPLHAFQGWSCTQNAPDLTAVAQYGFHKHVKQFTFQDRGVSF